MEENRPFLHTRQRGDGAVFAGVGELAVDLVGQHQQIVVNADTGDFLDFFGGQRGSRRVGREIQHDRFGVRRDGGRNVFGGQREFILDTGTDRFGNAVHQPDTRVIRDVARLVIEDFFAGIDDGPQRDVQTLAHADRYEY